MVVLVEMLQFRLHVEAGERERLGQARHDARPIATHAIALRSLGHPTTDICGRLALQTIDYVQNQRPSRRPEGL